MSFGALIFPLAICLFFLRLFSIAANVDVKAEATPLVDNPLEDDPAIWKVGMRSVAHQPSLAVLVTFDFWYSGIWFWFLWFLASFFLSFFCRKPAVRGKHLICLIPLCIEDLFLLSCRQKTVFTRSETSRPCDEERSNLPRLFHFPWGN